MIRICQQCGDSFEAGWSGTKFCKMECYRASRRKPDPCLQCTLPICDEKSKFCLYKEPLRAKWRERWHKYKPARERLRTLRAG